MLTQDAVQEISKLAIAGEAAQFLADNSTHTPSIIFPDDYSVQSLEYLQAAPSAFKGIYETDNLEEFANYVSKHADLANSVAFINAEKMTAIAIIDHGTTTDPQWRYHKAALTLIAEPEYKALLAFDGQNLAQLAFIDFIEEYKDIIQFIDQDPYAQLDYKESLRSFRTLNIESINKQTNTAGNFAASRSELEAIDIKGAGRELPWGFTFTCIPFIGLEKVTFTAQLRATKQGDTIALKYRLYQASSIKKAITENFKAKLNNELNAYVTVYIGQFKS